MHKTLSLTLLAFLLASCNAAPPGAHDISGVWTDNQGVIYCLDKDGMLGLPGQTAISGVAWSMKQGILRLTTLDAPGNEPQVRALTLKSSSPYSLEFMDIDGVNETWKKSNLRVNHLEGSLVFRERVALPPQVTLDVQLHPLHDGSAPVAMALTPITNHRELKFRIHYLPHAVSSRMRLTAAILLDSETLFITASDQTVSMNSQPTVLLQQAAPGEAQLPAISVPVHYKGTLPAAKGGGDIDVFLEKHGLALLCEPSGITLGSWLEKKGNRIIEIACGELPPLRLARNSTEGDMALTGISGSRTITLSPNTSLTWPDTPVSLEGTLCKVDGKPIFSECTSLRDLPVDASGRAYSQIDVLADRHDATVLVEGSLRNGILAVQKVFQVHGGGVCTTEQHASVPLTGTYWRMRELNDEAIQNFPDQPEPHLIFSEQHTASGSDGCNNFFMGWERNGQELRFTDGGSTLRLCPQGMEQSQAMHSMLTDVTSWNISGSKLELRTPRGVAAVFEAVDM